MSSNAYIKHNALMKKYFGHDAPDFTDIAKNVSLVITNQNIVFNKQAKVPAMLYVEMLHIKETKPLPEVKRMNQKHFLTLITETFCIAFISSAKNIIKCRSNEKLSRV